MTLVYANNTLVGPRTHALVVGVGHFPLLKGQTEKLGALSIVKDVTSPPNNARAIVNFLASNAERFIPTLATIDVLISEPQGDSCQIPVGSWPYDPRSPEGGAVIEPATGDRVESALLEWVARCEEDEHNLALLYGSSHGVQAQDHVLLLEDCGEKPHSKWDNTLSFNHLSQNLYCRTHLRSLLLADCCRDVLRGSRESLDPVSGRRIGPTDSQDYVAGLSDPNRAVYILRASPLGVEAKATKNGLGYFTEALLAAVEGAAGLHRPGFGWSVSPSNLRDAVESVGRYGLGMADKDLWPDDEKSRWVGDPILRLLERPKYPLRIRELNPLDNGRARLELRHGGGLIRTREPDIVGCKPLCVWVDPDIDAYSAGGMIPAIGAIPQADLEDQEVLVVSQGFDVPLVRRV